MPPQFEHPFYKISLKATRAIGSPKSILVHTILFIGIFFLMLFGFSFSDVLLILTTIVSLEAIYLAIFIQMTVNINTAHLYSVSKDVEEIQEDVDEISENVEDLQENIEEIQGDVEEIQEDVEEISEEISENSEQK
jgi:low affinity Fe/Cu permease